MQCHRLGSPSSCKGCSGFVEGKASRKVGNYRPPPTNSLTTVACCVGAPVETWYIRIHGSESNLLGPPLCWAYTEFSVLSPGGLIEPYAVRKSVVKTDTAIRTENLQNFVFVGPELPDSLFDQSCPSMLNPEPNLCQS